MGIQLTELKIEHRPHSSNVANKLTTNLLNFILKSIKPCSKILVNIYSNKDYKNDILKLNDKELKEIAKIIVDGINKEKFFPNPDEFFKNKPLKLAEVERDHIKSILRECEGNREKASDVLDISVRTLYNKIKQYGFIS